MKIRSVIFMVVANNQSSSRIRPRFEIASNQLKPSLIHTLVHRLIKPNQLCTFLESLVSYLDLCQFDFVRII